MVFLPGLDFDIDFFNHQIVIMSNSKKAFWFGLILVALQIIAPIINAEVLTWYVFVFPVASGVLVYLSKNLKGATWTVAGQLGAGLTAFFASHPTPDGITLKYVLSAWILPLLIQAVTAWMPNGEKSEDIPNP
jgi:hypothetical protein